MKPIETDRLLLRPFVAGDLQALFETIYSDPRVCEKFCGATKTLEDTRKLLAHKIDQAGHAGGFGSYAVIRKADGEFLGQMLLGPPELAPYIRFEDDPDARFNSIEVELGYAFGRRHWGNGYATEAGKALVEFAFRELKLKRLITGADKERNPRSHGLGERLGARYVRNVHPQWPGLVGILDNDLL